uniref:WWE domain-containing protein n=1 Tax=Panagrellus redivivus TaxID=6233 RepID=A0A7E4VCW0_PANRE
MVPDFPPPMGWDWDSGETDTEFELYLESAEVDSKSLPSNTTYPANPLVFADVNASAINKMNRQLRRLIDEHEDATPNSQYIEIKANWIDINLGRQSYLDFKSLMRPVCPMPTNPALASMTHCQKFSSAPGGDLRSQMEFRSPIAAL